jgi:hypothetical protein
MTTAWGRVEAERKTEEHGDLFAYLFAVFAGLLAGFVDIKARDLLLTALFVLAPCMLLGALRPTRPWRWVVVVGICVPLVDVIAYTWLRRQAYGGQTYGAALVFLPGIAGAYGGSIMRGVINNLFAGK